MGSLSFSQFHQHFTSSFCANIKRQRKLQSQTVIREKVRKTLLNKKKAACKVLIKLTPYVQPSCDNGIQLE
jgi:hypothetical protein